MVVGVLALQGDFAEHIDMLSALTLETKEVRTVADLAEVDALVIPGGESTVMMKLMKISGLDDALVQRVQQGFAVFGTCAGAIILSRSHLNLVDVSIDRNAYGSQLQSFSDSLSVEGIGTVIVEFIRAPKITEVGSDVTVLATHDGNPIVVRSGSLLLATCHTETTGDQSLHRFFVEQVCKTSAVERS